MANHSKIEWTDATWNPVTGCSIVSPGCTNCYAMRMAARMTHFEEAKYSDPSDGPYFGTTKVVNGNPVWTGHINLATSALRKPIGWKKPRRIFVNSMSDLFHEALIDSTIDEIFAVMALCPQHTFQILTKRPERMRAYIRGERRSLKPLNDALGEAVLRHGYDGPLEALRWPLPNVWLGVSCEDQKRHDERVPLLRNTPAATRFISFEPMLGPIKTDLTDIDWAIVGGESGPDARPMHPQWARDIRDQCIAAGTPFLFKQHGEWFPFGEIDANGNQNVVSKGKRPGVWHQWDGGEISVRLGKKAAGRFLDGVLHDEYPGG